MNEDEVTHSVSHHSPWDDGIPKSLRSPCRRYIMTHHGSVPVLPHVPLGSQGLIVSKQGLGCMGLTAFYEPADDEAALRTIAHALELGVTLFDTAWVYQRTDPVAGTHTNEELLGRAIAAHGRSRFVVSSKFGLKFSDDGGSTVPDSSKDCMRSQLADSLRRLGTDYVDLWIQHRSDPRVAVEDVMRVAKTLVAEGRVRFVGLSECTPKELRRAHAVHPVSAVQLEWSLQSRDAEAELVPACRELGVGVMAYSPLGRGLLSRTFARRSDLSPSDWRLKQPRFADEAAFNANAAAGERLGQLAKKRGVTAAQMALAWVHSRGDDVVPIPGARSEAHVEDNVRSARLELSSEECEQCEKAVPSCVGERYDQQEMKHAFNARSSEPATP